MNIIGVAGVWIMVLKAFHAEADGEVSVQTRLSMHKAI